MSVDSQPEGKTFGIRAEDAEHLLFTKQHLDAIYSAAISKLAVERFGYRITPFTQFRIKPDMSSVQIWERQPTPEEAAEMAGSPSSGIVQG